MGILGFGSKDKSVGPDMSGRTVPRYGLVRMGDETVDVDPLTGKPIGAQPLVAPNPDAVVSTNSVPPVEATLPRDPAPQSIEDKSPEVPSTGLEQLKSFEINSDSKPAVEAAPKSGDEASALADGASTFAEDQKTVLIDADYLRKLHDAVEGNSKQINEMIGNFNSLVEMIQTLKTDTVALLVQKSVQLEAANVELERLKSDEIERIRANDRMARENLKLKDKCDEYDSIVKDKDAQIVQSASDLKAAQEDSAAKDGKISELQKAQQYTATAHEEKIAKLKSDHDAEIADLKKKHEEAVEAVNKRAADEIEAMQARVNEFVPMEVCNMFDYRFGEQIEDRSRLQAIYAYLEFINGNLRPEAFVRRFSVFDDALYDAMRDAPDQLEECRVRVQRHINEELGKKTGGLLVCWPDIGEACNPDHYITTSDFGQRITEVISAMVYKKGDDEKVLCLRKGKVATA